MVGLDIREKSILKSIIQSFIHTASPVGSSKLAQHSAIGLKSASVRRIMASLEEKGYVEQPHTSAGRVPTTGGYRYYVNRLLQKSSINMQTKQIILQAVDTFDGDVNELLDSVSKVLAGISNQLGIILTPKFEQSLFKKIQLVPISVSRKMVILTTDNGTIKTIPIDVEPELDGHDVQKQVGILNKRLSGKTLRAAQDELKHFIAEIKQVNKPIYRLLVEIEHKVFNFNRYEGYRLTGTRNILAKPEFSDIQRVSTLMDLLEDREIIIHFLGQREVPPGVRITIGSEHRESRIQACTVITSTYKLGQTSGILGIIGPTRMPYRKMIPLVDFTARAISNKLNVC